MATWQKLLTKALSLHGESWQDLVSTTLTSSELNSEFDEGFGEPEGCSFTAWTLKRVYFPAANDGAEWVASAPRNPCQEKTKHIERCLD